MSRLRTAVLVVVAVAVGLPGVTGAGAAQDPATADGQVPRAGRVLATFQGRTINLAESWEGATVCAVKSQTDIRCASDEETLKNELQPEMRREARQGSGGVQAASEVCLGQGWRWVRVYEHSNYGGRAILFNEQNLWFNFAWVEFNDKTSAWWNDTACGAYMSEHHWGGGSLYYMPPYSWQPSVGWFNDKASAAYLIGY